MTNKEEKGILTLYSDVQATSVRWLWYPFIAVGKITLLQGDPGDGKSTMMMHLIAELSKGGTLPDGKTIGMPQRAIYQCSEDGISDTIKPRLEKCGADCRNVAFINEETYSGLTLDDERIRQAIIEFRPRLVVIDPIQAYLGSDSDLQIAGRARRLIVKDLSRLGRNYIEMGKYLEQIFPMMGIRFIAINDNYDNANTESSDSDSIVVPFKNLLNDSYCRDISIKVRSQLDIKRRKGEFIGGYAMYGYCKDERNKSRLVVDEYAAEIVRSIYRRKLEGMSAKAIAEQLNNEGVLAPSEYKRLCGLNYHSGFKAGTHAKWQAIQVLRILKNEVYTGTMVQGKRQKINYKIKKIRDVEEWSRFFHYWVSGSSPSMTTMTAAIIMVQPWGWIWLSAT